MRHAHTVEQVREAERALMARLPEGALMQRAAAGLCHAVLDLLGTAYGARVLLLVGSGDNGGDALFAGAMLARDRFFPRQFANLGDRLVYSNGIVVLSALAIWLLWHYQASVDSLIHLYVLGVFTAFTLSQAGMVVHWHRAQSPGWKRSVAVNALGAAATGLVVTC